MLLLLPICGTIIRSGRPMGAKQNLGIYDLQIRLEASEAGKSHI
jgi:hypothetical protein